VLGEGGGVTSTSIESLTPCRVTLQKGMAADPLVSPLGEQEVMLAMMWMGLGGAKLCAFACEEYLVGAQAMAGGIIQGNVCARVRTVSLVCENERRERGGRCNSMTGEGRGKVFWKAHVGRQVFDIL